MGLPARRRPLAQTGLLALMVALLIPLGSGGPPALAQTLALFPTSGGPGTPVHVSGSGFVPGETVSVRWGASTGQVLAQGAANGAGGIDISFTVPAGPAGIHDVWAIGVFSGTSIVGRFLVTGGGATTTAPPSPTAPPGAFPTLPPELSCLSQSAFVAPPAVSPGGGLFFTANGFAPFSSVVVRIFGPSTSGQLVAQASAACQVLVTIETYQTDPLGSYSVQASGAGFDDRPLQLTAFFTVVGATPTPTPTHAPTATPTPSIVCPLPSAFVSPPRVAPGQTGTFRGTGFQPGSYVRVEFQDLAGMFTFPFFAPAEVGPAATTCGVSGTFSANPTIPPGRYRLTLTGPNHLGVVVQARGEFEVAFGQPTPLAPVPVTPEPAATPPMPTPRPEAPPGARPDQVPPVAIEQTLTRIGGALVPAVGETTEYEHVVRITNTAGRALDLRVLSGGRDLKREAAYRAAAQGQGLTIRFATEYSEDTRSVRASANVGQLSLRGTSVIWDGQLAAGQTLELRTVIEHTPSTALVLAQPIRGQTVSIVDQRGLSLVVAPPPLPQLPPAQRLVQPAPPPVDPTTGSRFFSDTGFSIVNDSIWVFYHRRGGRRTFGAPISRVFLLGGATVQLFERAMLRADESGTVTALNLLEEPFLAYETLGDLRLPPVEQQLIENAPDPTAPDYGDQSQEFVRLHALEEFDDKAPRFYSTFLSTVLFRDAFFDGRGDPNLVPGFNLEIWGLPTSRAAYHVIGFELVPAGEAAEGEEPLAAAEVADSEVVLLRFQRGVMRHDAAAGETAAAPLGRYLRAVLTGDTGLPELAEAAGSSRLWGQYNPEAVNWVDRPGDLPDTNLVLAFEPE